MSGMVYGLLISIIFRRFLLERNPCTVDGWMDGWMDGTEFSRGTNDDDVIPIYF